MLRICSLLLCILLAPLPTTARVFTLPSDFSILHRTPPSHNITITIALAQHGVSDLHSLLQTLSNPHSPHYSQWRSKQNVETIVRASSNDVFRVTQWIHASIPSAAVQLHGSDALRFHRNSALLWYRLLGTKMVESGVSPGILPNFLSDYFIDIFGYKDLKIISHKSTKISKIW